MKKLVIGIFFVVIGLPCTAFFVSNLTGLILGALPPLLIIGGVLAVYLGIEDIRAENVPQDNLCPADPVHPPSPVIATPDSEVHSPGTESAAPWKSNEETPPEETLSSSAPSVDAEAFRGNTDTLVFHRISCNFSQGKNCTARFNSSEEAISAGFKPCKICTP